MMPTWTNRCQALLFGVSLFFACLIVVGLYLSCGCCEEVEKWDYIETPGTATILAVRDADPELYNCPNDPVEVLYEFTPDSSFSLHPSSIHHGPRASGSKASP